MSTVNVPLLRHQGLSFVDGEVSPIIEAAAATAERELPELLKTHPGQWVIYHGEKRLGFGSTRAESLQHRCRQGLQKDDLYVRKIEEVPPICLCW